MLGSRMKSALVLSTIVSFLLCIVVPVHARLVRAITFQELFERSDFVVIARPVAKTRDTKERTYFSDITRTERGVPSRVPATGVETVFEVSQVLKGSGAIKQITLHHYRENNSDWV